MQNRWNHSGKDTFLGTDQAAFNDMNAVLSKYKTMFGINSISSWTQWGDSSKDLSIGIRWDFSNALTATKSSTAL